MYVERARATISIAQTHKRNKFKSKNSGHFYVVINNMLTFRRI